MGIEWCAYSVDCRRSFGLRTPGENGKFPNIVSRHHYRRSSRSASQTTGRCINELQWMRSIICFSGPIIRSPARRIIPSCTKHQGPPTQPRNMLWMMVIYWSANKLRTAFNRAWSQAEQSLYHSLIWWDFLITMNSAMGGWMMRNGDNGRHSSLCIAVYTRSPFFLQFTLLLLLLPKKKKRRRRRRSR